MVIAARVSSCLGSPRDHDLLEHLFSFGLVCILQYLVFAQESVEFSFRNYFILLGINHAPQILDLLPILIDAEVDLFVDPGLLLMVQSLALPAQLLGQLLYIP